MNSNTILILFVYGLAFFTMGFAIFLKVKKTDYFELSKWLWLLGLFGIIHGINEWTEAYTLLNQTNASNLLIQKVNVIVLILSFLSLFLFGIAITTLKHHYFKTIISSSFVIFFMLLGISLYLTLFSLDLTFWKNNLDILARYFLGLPAGILTAVGFLLLAKSKELQLLEPKNLHYSFLSAAGFMFGYAFFSGIIVRPALFFPATIINTQTFLQTFTMPVQVFRALMAIGVTISVVKFLKIFDIETTRKSELEKKNREIIRALQTVAHIIEMHEYFFTGHHQHVAKLALAIAKEMKLSKEDADNIFDAALIHDIGKIDIPIEILNKPTELIAEEVNIINNHPQIGYDIAMGMGFSKAIATIILQHHEYLNGSGYPKGLRGNEISLGGQILAVAETVEDICALKLFKSPQGIKDALEVIKKNKNILFDPIIVDACVKVISSQSTELSPLLDKKIVTPTATYENDR